MLIIASVFLMAVFVVRLFYLQVIEHSKYSILADAEQVKRLTIPATRGEIYMEDNGTPVKVVLNETVYTMFVDPKIITDPEAVKDVIREVAGGNTVDGFAKLVDKKDTRYQVVAKNVTRRQAELIKKKELAGIGFQAVVRRVYPEGTLAAQTLGFVNYDQKGQYGIEGRFDKQLRGKDGMLQSVTDVSNVPLTIGNRNVNIPAQNGANIVLTLDRNVQAYTEKALSDGLRKIGATDGSVIVMDPNDGSVLAMANFPTYNPSKFAKVTNANAFNNAVVSDPYEPGSVVKTFTVATGINTNTITPQSTYVNTDYITIDDRTITNATKGQTGTISIQHALTWSLNTGMVTVAQRLGGGTINRQARNTMYSYFHDRFHLGQMTGIETTGEVPGELIPPTAVEGNAVRYSNMSFGQGMNPTMIQVAAGFSSLINGGTYYYPTIIKGNLNDDGDIVPAKQKKPQENVINASTSATMRTMILKARREFYAGNDRKGYDIGGKTGTSQDIVNGEYTFDETTGTYIGFGGDTKPKYVIMVRVSSKGRALNGGDHALPIFTDISNWMIDYLKLQPKG